MKGALKIIRALTAVLLQIPAAHLPTQPFTNRPKSIKKGSLFDFLYPTSKMVIAFQDHYNLLKNVWYDFFPCFA